MEKEKVEAFKKSVKARGFSKGTKITIKLEEEVVLSIEV